MGRSWCQSPGPSLWGLGRSQDLWGGLVLLVLILALQACRPQYPAAVQPELPLPERPDLVVEAERAAQFIGHAGVSFVDARASHRYLRGHVPGAVHVDWRDFVSSQRKHPDGRLAVDSTYLGGVLGGLGVSGDDWVIVLGDPLNGWGEDGRIAWTLMSLGVDRLSLVNGGFPAWEASGLPVQRGRIRRPPVPWRASLRDDYVARKRDVIDIVDRGGAWDYVLVDVRSSGEFRGAFDAPRHGVLRPGHIPTSVNLPWRELLAEDGRFLPREKLEGLLIPRGVRPDAQIVTYCTGGVRSAHTWFVLHWLGYPSVRSYAGSLWEWSMDRGLPVEKGGHRPRQPGPPWPTTQ